MNGLTRAAALTAAASVTALVVCWLLDIPLGIPERLTYRYSPLITERLLSALRGAIPAALTVFGAWLLLSPDRRRHVLGGLLLAAGIVGLGAWSFFAPPQAISQHYFNFLSPSHDGAFLREAEQIESLAAYLRAFPERAALPPEVLLGTRVLSNPPGMTIVAYGVQTALDHAAWLSSWIDRNIVRESTGDPVWQRQVVTAIACALLLHLCWLVAWVPWAAVAALLGLSGRAGIVVGLLAILSPASMLFTPGKDVTQLLTSGVLVLLLITAQRQSSVLAAGAGGALWSFARTLGAVHDVLLLVVLAALLVAHFRPPDEQRAVPTVDRTQATTWLRGIMPALAFVVCAGIVHTVSVTTLGLDIQACVSAALNGQAQVTRGPHAMPWYEQLVGVPLFLLFAGPALLALLTVGARRISLALQSPATRLASVLAVLAAVTPLATVIRTNAETPRLWLPFAALATVSLARLVVGANDQRAQQRTLTLILALQLAATLIAWGLMDMREAEFRLLQDGRQTGRFFE